MVEKGIFSKAFISVFVILTFASSAAYGAELLVPQSFKTIGEAVTKASSGDTVVVAAGIYKENVVIKSGVTLKGAGSGKGARTRRCPQRLYTDSSHVLSPAASLPPRGLTTFRSGLPYRKSANGCVSVGTRAMS